MFCFSRRSKRSHDLARILPRVGRRARRLRNKLTRFEVSGGYQCICGMTCRNSMSKFTLIIFWKLEYISPNKPDTWDLSYACWAVRSLLDDKAAGAQALLQTRTPQYRNLSKSCPHHWHWHSMHPNAASAGILQLVPCWKHESMIIFRWKGVS